MSHSPITDIGIYDTDQVACVAMVLNSSTAECNAMASGNSHHWFCRVALATLVSSTVLFSPLSLLAQTLQPGNNTIFERLASAKDENPTATVINQSALSEFRSLVPLELRPLLEAGAFTLSSFRAPRFAGSFVDQTWLAASAEHSRSPVSEDVLAQEGMPEAYPFGDYTSIVQRPALSLSQRVEQILWNTQSVSAPYASFHTDFEWRDMAPNQQIFFRGVLQRIIPKRFREEDKTEQLFRERLLITSPKITSGLSWLTFRFAGQAEDVVWAYSPAIKKTRQLVSTNRSDLFLATAASLDDLLGYSSKVQQFEGVSVKEETLLMPLRSLDRSLLGEEGEGCFLFDQRQDKKSRTVPLLAQSEQRSPSLGGDPLSHLVFVPRAVLRIALAQRDPFSLNGRQVLYVGRDDFLPFLQVLYDREGVLAKVVFNSFVSTSTKDEKIKRPLVTETIAYSQKEKAFSVVSYQGVRFCQRVDPKLAIADFDPKALSDERSSTPRISASPSAQPADAGVEAAVAVDESQFGQ